MTHAQEVNVADNKRNVQRRRALKDGKIVFGNGFCVVDCTIKNMSENGALLIAPKSVGVPNSFVLIDSKGQKLEAEVRWRKLDSLGVRFTGARTAPLVRS
jgi:hypothetical protein